MDNGTRWLALLLDDAQAVLALEPEHAVIRRFAKIGVVGPHARGSETQFEVRGFAAPAGIDEDPVTGSLNAMLAQWLIGERIAPARYIAAQGTRLGREGRVHVRAQGDDIWVGGDTRVTIEGRLAM